MWEARGSTSSALVRPPAATHAAAAARRWAKSLPPERCNAAAFGAAATVPEAGATTGSGGGAGDGAAGLQLLRRVAIFVEPSPFSHVSGMKNRFENLIRELRKAGDDVLVITPDPKPPKEFCGARVRAARCRYVLVCAAEDLKPLFSVRSFT